MPFANRIAEADRLQQEINRHLPLAVQALQHVGEHFRLRLTWANCALEGNRLSEAEAEAVLANDGVFDNQPSKDQLEVFAHAEAFDVLWKQTGRPGITEGQIRKLHELLYRRTDPANAGRYRKVEITFPASDTIFPPPSALEERMGALVAEIPRLREENHPIAFAALLHTRLLTLHPFLDGNGRVGRLLMNRALLRGGYPATVIRPELRGAYLAAIREGDAGEVAPFTNLLSDMVCESQRDYLRLLERLKRG